MNRGGLQGRRRSRSRSPIRGDRGPRRPADNKLVYLSNLPYELRWMELKTLIREKAGEVTFLEIIEERNGRSKGCAVVEFTTLEAAKEAISKLNGLETHGRNIVAKDIQNPEAFFRRIKEDTGLDFRTGRDGGRRRRSPSPRREADQEMYGLSPSFLRQHNIAPPLVERVFVANLAFNVTSGMVWELFSMAGKVVYIDVQMDKEGKSKGIAVVEFTHPLEAVQAIAMFNNQKFYDRGLSVKMDRFDKRKPLAKGELPRGLNGIGMGLGANGAPLTDVASVLTGGVKEDHPMVPILNPMPYDTGFPSAFPSAPVIAPAPYKAPDAMYRAPVVDSFPPQHVPIVPSGRPFDGPPSMQMRADNDGFGAGFGGRGGAGDYGNNARNAGMGGGGTGGYAPPPQRDNYRDGPIGGMGGANAFPARDNNNSFGRGGDRGDSYNGNGNIGGAVAQSFVKKEAYEPAYSGAYPDRNPAGGPYSSRIILIKNLPTDYTWQIVRDRALNFGEVESCDLLQPGIARVRFSQNSEAERARGALAGTSVEGRPISVDFVPS